MTNRKKQKKPDIHKAIELPSSGTLSIPDADMKVKIARSFIRRLSLRPGSSLIVDAGTTSSQAAKELARFACENKRILF